MNPLRNSNCHCRNAKPLLLKKNISKTWFQNVWKFLKKKPIFYFCRFYIYSWYLHFASMPYLCKIFHRRKLSYVLTTCHFSKFFLWDMCILYIKPEHSDRFTFLLLIHRCNEKVCSCIYIYKSIRQSCIMHSYLLTHWLAVHMTMLYLVVCQIVIYVFFSFPYIWIGDLFNIKSETS